MVRQNDPSQVLVVPIDVADRTRTTPRDAPATVAHFEDHVRRERLVELVGVDEAVRARTHAGREARRVVEDCPGRISVRERKRRAAQVRTSEVTEVRDDQASPDDDRVEVRVAQVRAREAHALDLRAVEVRAAEVGTGEVGARQPGVRELRSDELRAAQHAAPQESAFELRAREIAPREIVASDRPRPAPELLPRRVDDPLVRVPGEVVEGRDRVAHRRDWIIPHRNWVSATVGTIPDRRLRRRGRSATLRAARIHREPGRTGRNPASCSATRGPKPTVVTALCSISSITGPSNLPVLPGSL
ncbi:MAG: hypothetical protein R3F34_01960 [Planctomycetota bacterium]